MNWLPEHKGGFFLTHNEHRNYYESAQEFIENRNLEDEFTSPEEMQKAIAEDSIWHLQWYPDTPIGFHSVCAASLEAIRAFVEANWGSVPETLSPAELRRKANAPWDDKASY